MSGLLSGVLLEMVLENVHAFLGNLPRSHEILHICQSCLEVCDCMDLNQEEAVDEEGPDEDCGFQTCWRKGLRFIVHYD